MQLEVRRKWYTEESTIGELYVDGLFQCYTLEDRIRKPGVKVPKQTCIAAGLYRLVINFSQRFQRLLPQVLDVPMFEGVRIHPGNMAVDTEGCILVGTARDHNFVGNSRLAFGALWLLLEEGLTRDSTIEVINATPPPEDLVR
jgi:hypothetical protein